MAQKCIETVFFNENLLQISQFILVRFPMPQVDARLRFARFLLRLVEDLNAQLTHRVHKYINTEHFVVEENGARTFANLFPQSYA